VLWALGWPARSLLLALVAVYRVSLSPFLGGRCRFHPSCSAYAEEAIRTHGAAKGFALAAWRVLRCSPLSAGGIDPVPAHRTHGRNASHAPDARQYDAIISAKETAA
jgi:putative membrane protein insertion efficiency factor